MIAKAIVREGGLFIPNVKETQSFSQQEEVKIQFEILEASEEDSIFQKAAGVLKHRNIDPLQFHQDAGA